YGTSGISFLTSTNVGTDTTNYRQIVRGNAVSSVRNDYPCQCDSYKSKTDGNGIIVDTLRKGGYTGRTLIENNLVFQNGARGIHVFNSANVDIFNNTTDQNGQVTETAQ